jgi:quercetin 2,3-dioxygenase
MQSIRRSEDRGFADHGWLKSHHSFSFAGYYDPAHLGFANLRVINDDQVAPGMGFGTHPHQDMEIVTYVLRGALAHKDSMGNGSTIHPGDVQRMTAGSGITHSEFNPSPTQAVNFLQIWILPDRTKLQPSYDQAHFSDAQKRDRWCVWASSKKIEGAMQLNADAKISASLMSPAANLRLPTTKNRAGYLHVAYGQVQVGEHELRGGDALKLIDEDELPLRAIVESEVLFFELPKN